MKNVLIYLFVISILWGCSSSLSREQGDRLLKYYKEKNFFKLESLLSGLKAVPENPDILLYRATIGNVFNKPEESNRLIMQILNKYPHYFNDTILKELYYMHSANAYRLQDYKTACYDDSIILNKYKQVCDSSELETRTDDMTMYKSLGNVPKMMVSLEENSKVPMSRDLAGLQTVRTILGGDSVDFILDTGAAFSVMIESVAHKYGIRYLDGLVRTGTSTNKKVEGRMGLLDIRLGNIGIKNVPFLVLPDSILTFANGQYVIKGIIGFPVLYAFKGFTVEDNQHLTVTPMNPEKEEKNFAIDGQYIIIRVITQGDTLPFIFDSGNQTTFLSAAYYLKNKSEIDKKYKMRPVQTGGAGGVVTTEAYQLDSLPISAGNSSATLDSILIYPKDLSGYDMKYVYGNFGQDYISRFTTMKINFSDMIISFERKKLKKKRNLKILPSQLHYCYWQGGI